MSSKKMPHMAGLIRTPGASALMVMRAGSAARASFRSQHPNIRKTPRAKIHARVGRAQLNFWVVPEGLPRIAQAFKPGTAIQRPASPEGTAEKPEDACGQKVIFCETGKFSEAASKRFSKCAVRFPPG